MLIKLAERDQMGHVAQVAVRPIPWSLSGVADVRPVRVIVNRQFSNTADRVLDAEWGARPETAAHPTKHLEPVQPVAATQVVIKAARNHA